SIDERRRIRRDEGVEIFAAHALLKHAERTLDKREMARPVRIARRDRVELLIEHPLGCALLVSAVFADEAHQIELRDGPPFKERPDGVARTKERKVSLGMRDHGTQAAEL